eukprot:TRINITY_DN12827_c0_g1_i1.p1 TRINITY_DN12827_c0_g1~~TRINITY_DN12827_c0_g1_i1.p1  ORF type:complete len:333 (+),score=70.30 TRINITY_DN12827_c0_g1_i1:91-1089(+)
MAPGIPGSVVGNLDDVQVLGVWNFTLQSETPLYWLRCGRLDKYLLKFKVQSPCPGTYGLVVHAEADLGGSDGTSFWVERRPGEDGNPPTKRYCLSGQGLESRPILTRTYADSGMDEEEEIEVLMQGYSGVVLAQNRKVQLKFRTKIDRGSIAFYNSTVGARDDVHFSGVRITALRRGPMEVTGVLSKRENQMMRTSNSFRGNEEEGEGDGALEAGASGASFHSRGSKGPGRSTGNWSVSNSGTPVNRNSGKGFGKGLGRSQGSGVLRSASEGVLRKTTSGASMHGTRGGASGKKWVALAKNAPASETDLIKSTMHAKPSNRACTDFIAMANT